MEEGEGEEWKEGKERLEKGNCLYCLDHVGAEGF